MEPRKINSYKDLQMEKYRLRVSIDYTGKRLGDNWAALKSFASPENLAFEAGRMFTSLISGKTPSDDDKKKLLPEGELGDAGHFPVLPDATGAPVTRPPAQVESKKGPDLLVILMPFVIGAISTVLGSMLGGKPEGKKGA